MVVLLDGSRDFLAIQLRCKHGKRDGLAPQNSRFPRLRQVWLQVLLKSNGNFG